MKYTTPIWIVLITCVAMQAGAAEKTVDLRGTWSFQLDDNHVGQREHWFEKDLQDKIRLADDKGPGKSTLMRILAGAVRQSSGTITLDGKPVTFTCPAHAIALGKKTSARWATAQSCSRGAAGSPSARSPTPARKSFVN